MVSVTHGINAQFGRYEGVIAAENSMKNRLVVNVDTIEFEVKSKGMSLPNARSVNLMESDGSFINNYENRVLIKGKDDAHNLSARVTHTGTILNIEGSPYGFLQGQNTFAPNSVPDAAFEALLAVSKALNVKRRGHGWDSPSHWCGGDINLKRVDLAVNLMFSDYEELRYVLSQTKIQWAALDIAAKIYPTTAVWTPKNGRNYSIRMYAKGDQIVSTGNHQKSPEYERLAKETHCVLRIELQLRKPELEVLGLTRLKGWKKGTAERVFQKYMDLMPISDIKGGPISRDILRDLPTRLRHVLATYVSGVNLRDVYDPRTLSRHIKDLKEFGWDIRQPYNIEKTLIPIKKLLDTSKAIKQPPQWLVDKGFFHILEE